MLGRRFVSKQLGPAFATPINRGYRPAFMAKAKTALDEMDKGEFRRTAAGFRSVLVVPSQGQVAAACCYSSA